MGVIEMSYQISLDQEEVTKLIAKDLMESYDDNLKEPYNDKMLEALKVVIEYYTAPSEYDEWLNILDEQKKSEK
jgi:hypothetical protein